MNPLLPAGRFLQAFALLAIALTVAACGGSGAPVTSNTVATVQSTSDALAFSAATYATAQTSGTVTLSVSRTGAMTGAVSVEYATADGTAIAGADYTAASGMLQWADSDSSAKSITVPISKAVAFSGNKTFNVTLSSPGGGATVGTPASATVTITGSTATAAGNVQLSAATYSVGQAAGKVTVTVSRSGGSTGAVSVAYATTGGTAVSGTDFTASSGTLNWAAGDAAAKTFSVSVSNATPFSGSKAFTVALSAPSGGAVLGSPTSATVTITGSAAGSAAGTLQFAAASQTVAQSAGTVAVAVNRTGGSTGAVSVGYTTAAGTAVAGTDFTAASGTLNWASGDATAKTISVTISTATAFIGTKTFTVVLSGPGGGATLVSPSSTSVNISGTGTSGPTASAPGAPTDLVLTNEGTNTETMQWTAAAPGPAPISHYNIYRNGVAYATATTTTYMDSAATNATVPKTFGSPATIYAYTVSAVDADGNEGPVAANMTYWVYHAGTYFWEGDFSDVTLNYKDTSGAPQSGTADISVTANVTNGYAQPFSGPTASPEWAAELGGFKYMILDLKPTVANQTWRLNIISRLPQGDVFNNAALGLPGNYGPKPVVGQWASYKVPLNPDLAVGTGSFVGSISGSVLTVTAVNPGMTVQTTAWLFGPGIPANTTINSFGTGKGGAGTYNLNNSATVPAGTTINMQRTNMYKFSVIDNTGVGTNVYYMDNIGFTTN